MSVVIEVENLAKMYRLGMVGQGSLTDDLKMAWARMTGKENPFKKVGTANVREEVSRQSDYVWALRDINFSVNEGEVFGIVGRNGAGKSTLLKLLSRVTAPTEGVIRAKGRIASLLEVGTGFHPELSGRENIYLNGAILGMTKAEITRKFDEIVDFSGVSRYVDTPVKRYSSVMYVRLAFAVAAHLEPEILVIDEVLAVGDIAFQKKCLGKMKDVAGQGRTVLFVSHNMQAVRTLCSSAMLLTNGTVMDIGNTESIIDQYKKSMREQSFSENSDISNAKNRRGSGAWRFSDIRILNGRGEEADQFDIDDPIIFDLEVVCNEHVSETMSAAVMLKSGMTNEAVTSANHVLPFTGLQPGERKRFRITFEAGNLRPGGFPTLFWLGPAEGNKDFDTVDDVTSPITVTSQKSFQDLRFEPGRFSGYFSIPSKLDA